MANSSWPMKKTYELGLEHSIMTVIHLKNVVVAPVP
ncbi:hypothetical protein PC116_g10860 [Phytophthora cactorum]|nr:hypothetical protein Pcac1_g21824 [Phytophthora cactorum]KAG3024624.1 hypothetical protein PC119_g8438 [Phytophthora cactorum]KAG4241224.1 hypothetical protein PC116_g10860 [Phytophthora cactorum]